VRRITKDSDGSVRPLLGVTADIRFGFATALSVPPLTFPRVRTLIDDLSGAGFRDLATLRDTVPTAVGHPDQVWFESDLRWTTSPPVTGDAGRWCRPSQLAPPPEAAPSAGPILLSTDRRGRYRASVRLHRHTNFAYELVLDAAATTGRDVSAALLAQAARSVVANGALPFVTTDLRDPGSAAVHAAAGFEHRGWHLIELSSDDRSGTSALRQARAGRLTSCAQ
jgi:hypothetical protein